MAKPRPPRLLPRHDRSEIENHSYSNLEEYIMAKLTNAEIIEAIKELSVLELNEIGRAHV